MKLQQRERKIRQLAEQIERCGLDIGRELIAIDENDEWKQSDAASFDEYLKQTSSDLVGKSWQWAYQLIQAAKIESSLDVKTGFKASH
jgi:hypothetical protein